MIIIILVLGFFILLFFYKLVTIYSNNPSWRWVNLFFMLFYLGAFVAFFIFLADGQPYYKAIDPIDSFYEPFASLHSTTLLVFYVLFLASVFAIWLTNFNLPPLTLVIAFTFVLIGMILSFPVLYQCSFDSNLNEPTPFTVFTWLPLSNIFIAIFLFVKLIKREAVKAETRVFKNKWLNILNSIVANTKYQALIVVALLLPVFGLVTFILIIFGQDYNALVKVFTDTTTWALSQKQHPPYLDHSGHYLCTVAACGDPEIVKPIHLGKRNNQVIIVNRQLQIANAFEEMVQKISPKLHQIIRHNYDKYGYPISVKITTASRSNLVYIVMKPLEWLFLVALYLFCLEPEKMIKKQYRAA